MRIIVLVKQVPETDALTLAPVTGTVVRSEESAIVNPLDLYALETALRLKDQDASTRIAAVSMGPPQAESALREALAMGCDEAFLVTGREFGGADTWATGRALSAALKKIGPFDFIFAGEKATDGDTGQVGPEVAAFLGLPVATYIGKLEREKSGAGARLRMERILEDGVQVLECGAPALLTFCKAVGEPRLPELAGKRRARAASIARLGLADLDLPPEEAGSKGSPTRVVKVDMPNLARKTELIDARTEDGMEKACEKVVRLLLDKRLIVALAAQPANAAQAASAGKKERSA
jgi:electron transfer flavoprotein beta subunit